jgi:hypothetical protein
VVEERDDENDTTAMYVHGNYIDETICLVKPTGEKYWFHTDDLFSTQMLTDDEGDVVERMHYSDYGEPRWFDGAGSPLAASSVGNVRAFQGREWVGEGYNWRTRQLYGPGTSVTVRTGDIGNTFRGHG